MCVRGGGRGGECRRCVPQAMGEVGRNVEWGPRGGALVGGQECCGERGGPTCLSSALTACHVPHTHQLLHTGRLPHLPPLPLPPTTTTQAHLSPYLDKILPPPPLPPPPPRRPGAPVPQP